MASEEHNSRISQCPVTGLQVERRSEWQDVQLTGEYSATFSVIGGQVLHSVPRGNVGHHGLPRFFDKRRQVLEQAGLWQRPHCEIKDYSGVPLRHPRQGRVQFGQLLSADLDRGWLRGYWGYGGPAIFRWIMTAAKAHLDRRDAPCYFVGDYATAITAAIRALQDTSLAQHGPQRRADWTAELDGFRVWFEIQDGHIVVEHSAGHLRPHHVPAYIKVLERVLAEPGFFPEGKFVQINDGADLERMDWRAVVLFSRSLIALHQRRPCRGLVVCNAPRSIAAINKLGRYAFPFPFVTVRDLTDARTVAQQLYEAAPRQGLLQRLRGPWRYSEDELRRRVAELVRFGSSINWRSEGFDEPVEEPDNPLEPLYALLQVLKLDFDTILQEREAMQSQVLQAAKLSSITTLTAGVAHELNSPLTAVVGYAEKLQEQSSDPRAMQHATRILKCAHRMRDIIDQLAVYSRTGADGPVEPLDVNSCLEESLSLVEPLTEKHRMSVRCELAPGLPPIQCDRNHLQSVFYNVLINAYDAYQNVSDERPRTVHLSTASDGDWVRIQCRDRGLGMPSDVLERAFDPFFTTKDVGQGTGLGLYVTHRLVTNYGGRIHLDSGRDHGTTVEITFPTSRQPAGTTAG